MDDRAFGSLEEFLNRVPALSGSIAHGVNDEGLWWLKFSIDSHHGLAWHTVQELGHVLNYLSLEERLPTRFYPVSPPPYLNGGPDECLSWVIENTDPEFRPGHCAKWLEARMPNPVEDLNQWPSE